MTSQSPTCYQWLGAVFTFSDGTGQDYHGRPVPSPSAGG